MLPYGKLKIAYSFMKIVIIPLMFLLWAKTKVGRRVQNISKKNQVTFQYNRYITLPRAQNK